MGCKIIMFANDPQKYELDFFLSIHTGWSVSEGSQFSPRLACISTQDQGPYFNPCHAEPGYILPLQTV